MNPTGPVGPRSIGAFAFAIGFVVKQSCMARPGGLCKPLGILVVQG
jgi:hypothetical protein